VIRMNWDAGQDIDRLLGQMNRLFAQTLRNGGWDDAGDAQALRPAVQLTQLDDGFRLAIDLPGVPQENLDVEVQDRTLTVRGRRGEGGLRYERSLTVPDTIDLERLSAESRDGVLYLSLPTREQVRPRRVPINAGVGASTIEAGTIDHEEAPEREREREPVAV
jgi:HSP20 family protein